MVTVIEYRECVQEKSVCQVSKMPIGHVTVQEPYFIRNNKGERVINPRRDNYIPLYRCPRCTGVEFIECES